MSAYIVSRDHIRFLVTAAVRSVEDPRGSGIHHIPGMMVDQYMTDEALTALGQKLWDENIASVRYRYGDSDDLPGPIDEDYRYQHELTYAECPAAGVLSAIQCYEYQSCEHPGWATSAAKEFCDTLFRRYVRKLPGVGKALEEADWGPPKGWPESHERGIPILSMLK